MTTQEVPAVRHAEDSPGWECVSPPGWVERHPRRSTAVLLCLLAALWLVEAAVRPMWLDELLTFYTTQQPSAREVVRSIEEGCDGAAPAYALLVRALQPLLGNGPLALRLPALAGYGVLCWTVFAFARRRLPALYSVLAMLIVCNAAWPYATEGRAYGLVLGCAGTALLCWQRAAEGRRRPLALAGLAASLSLAVALHYYAVFLLIPVLAGEVARWRARAKLDLPVLAVLTLPPIVLVPHLQLIRAAQSFMPFFWAKGFPSDLSDFYFQFFSFGLRSWIPTALVLYLLWRRRAGVEPLLPARYRRPPMPHRERFACGALAVLPLFYFLLSGSLEVFWISTLVGLYAAWRFLSRREPPRSTGRPAPMPLHEWIACATLALLPVVVALLAYSTVRIFVTRYALPGVIGVGLVAAAAAFHAFRGSKRAAVCLTVSIVAWIGVRSAQRIFLPAASRDGNTISELLQMVEPDPPPVLVANPLAYVELAFYSQPPLRSRLVYAVDSALERKYVGVDTISRIIVALRRRVALQAPDREAFLRSNRRFLLALSPGYEYMLTDLIRSGFHVTRIARHQHSLLYRAEAGASQSPRRLEAE